MNRRSLGFFGLLWVSLALVVLAFPCNATDVEEEGSVPEFYSLPQFLEADPSLELPGGEKSMEDILHGEGTVTEFLLSRQVRLWRKAPDGPDDLYQEFEKTNWSNELSQSSRWVNLTDEECQQSMSLVTEFNHYGPDPLCGPFKPSLAMWIRGFLGEELVLIACFSCHEVHLIRRFKDGSAPKKVAVEMSPELEQCLFDLALKAYPQDEDLAKFKLIKRRRGTRPVAEMLADPFQTFSLRRGSDESKVETSKKFVTTLGVEVNALRPDPFVHLKRDEWPNIKPPVAFNHLFQKPLMLARLEGGYLASFEAGEFGGGLFYAQEEDEGWTRLIVGHFQDIQIFDQDHVLVTGGLEHMWVNGGETYLLTRTRQSKWKSRHVFSSRDGMPRLVGFCDLKALLGNESLFLYVLAVNSPSGFEWFLGVDKTGTVHVLGEREK